VSDVQPASPAGALHLDRGAGGRQGARNVDKDDARTVEEFGYRQELHRKMGWFSTFAISFSLMSITTGVFANYGFGLSQAGPRFVWTWVIVGIGNILIALALAHLSTRVPLSGYAYQWSSHMVNRRYGWFPGWLALVGWLTGTPGVAYAFAQYFAPYIGLGSATSTIVIVTAVVLLSWMAIHLVGIRLASLVNNFSVATELLGALLVGAGLLIYSLIHGTHNVSFLTHHGTAGTLGLGAFASSSLVAAYTLTGFEGAADLAEESHDPRRLVPRAIVLSVVISAVLGFVVLLGFTLAIPNLGTATASSTPLLYIAKHYLGSVVTPLFMVTVFTSIFACGLINLAAVTRLGYSMSRDGMLPWSGAIKSVRTGTGSPWVAVIVATIISIAFTIFAKAESIITSVSSVVVYASYALVIIAGLRTRTPAPEGNYFSLGRWFRPVSAVALVWIVALIVALTVAPGGDTIWEASAVSIALGVIWYLVWVRRITAAPPGDNVQPKEDRLPVAAP
jgi:amino acid transporter